MPTVPLRTVLPNRHVFLPDPVGWGYWAGCYSDDVLDLYLGGAQFNSHPRFLTVINEVFTIFLQYLKANVRVVP
jgi:hypothetical protein